MVYDLDLDKLRLLSGVGDLRGRLLPVRLPTSLMEHKARGLELLLPRTSPRLPAAGAEISADDSSRGRNPLGD
ncbi:hypothetical protein A2U01_0062589 [Trifolium medium]|uniref:Uncharacterized protein n=1 Tax=Trifolium medium TaxID=97028 RepID=A0A392S0J7_9FABA|nr:hypothetical protein [Trifolium medium]